MLLRAHVAFLVGLLLLTAPLKAFWLSGPLPGVLLWPLWLALVALGWWAQAQDER